MYMLPTYTDFVSRFPAFASVDASVIAQALTEAECAADDSWVSETDFRLARMLYAAHTLTLDGFGTGAEAEQARAGTSVFSRIKSASLELQRDVASKSGVSATSYGQRYLEILRRNRSFPLVATVDA